jgi:hypothetical protein
MTAPERFCKLLSVLHRCSRCFPMCRPPARGSRSPFASGTLFAQINRCAGCYYTVHQA